MDNVREDQKEKKSKTTRIGKRPNKNEVWRSLVRALSSATPMDERKEEDVHLSPGLHLEKLIARPRRCGYLPQDLTKFEELAGTADHQLLKSADHQLLKSIITNPHHVLRRYFPEKKPFGYNLRPRVQNCELPVKDT